LLNYDDLRDDQFITLISNGEKEALDVFYNRHTRSVFSLARYMLRDTTLAEEATQDIFMNLWLKASSYNPQRGKPKAWFMSIAHHRIIDLIRARKRHVQSTNEVSHELLDLHPSSGPGTEELAYPQPGPGEDHKGPGVSTLGAAGCARSGLLRRVLPVGDRLQAGTTPGYCKDPGTPEYAKAACELPEQGGTVELGLP
jgi:RNA polymerase sigma factor (sigma-70 family)